MGQDRRAQVGEVGLHGRVGMVVREAAVDKGVEQVVRAGQAGDQPLHCRTCSAVPAVPGDLQRRHAAGRLGEARHIGVQHQGLLHRTARSRPPGRGRQVRQGLAMDALGPQQELEAVLVGGIMGGGDHDPAVQLQPAHGEGQHGRGTQPDALDRHAALHQPAHKGGLQPRRGGAPIPADADPAQPPRPGLGGVGEAERPGVRRLDLARRLAADVVGAHRQRMDAALLGERFGASQDAGSWPKGEMAGASSANGRGRPAG